MADMERTQRQDINEIHDDRLTLAIDPLNLDSESHTFELTKWYGNNWLLMNGAITKYNVVENDTLYFINDALSQFLQKDISSVTLSFDYEVGSTVILDSISILHDGMTQYKNVESRIFGIGHIDVPCQTFGLDKDVLNSIISEQGFDIGITFDGDKSNASVSIRNVKLVLEFTDRLEPEILAVSNRITASFDVFVEEEDLVIDFLGDGQGDHSRSGGADIDE